MQARREELECQLRARRDEAEEAEHRTAQRRQEDQSRLEAASREVRASEEAPVGVGAGEGSEGDGVDALVGPEEAEEEVDVDRVL